MNIIMISISLCVVCVLFCIVLYRWQSNKIFVKITLAAVFVAMCIFALVHSSRQLDRIIIEREFIDAFNNDEILTCLQNGKNIEVSKEHFIYFYDQSYFFGKEGYKNMGTSIHDCKSHKMAQKSEIIND